MERLRFTLGKTLFLEYRVPGLHAPFVPVGGNDIALKVKLNDPCNTAFRDQIALYVERGATFQHVRDKLAARALDVGPEFAARIQTLMRQQQQQQQVTAAGAPSRSGGVSGSGDAWAGVAVNVARGTARFPAHQIDVYSSTWDTSYKSLLGTVGLASSPDGGGGGGEAELREPDTKLSACSITEHSTLYVEVAVGRSPPPAPPADDDDDGDDEIKAAAAAASAAAAAAVATTAVPADGTGTSSGSSGGGVGGGGGGVLVVTPRGGLCVGEAWDVNLDTGLAAHSNNNSSSCNNNNNNNNSNSNSGSSSGSSGGSGGGSSGGRGSSGGGDGSGGWAFSSEIQRTFERERNQIVLRFNGSFSAPTLYDQTLCLDKTKNLLHLKEQLAARMGGLPLDTFTIGKASEFLTQEPAELKNLNETIGSQVHKNTHTYTHKGCQEKKMV
jgi:hypothetical protein